MKVLYVVGSCLTKNTSANMSHNAYIQGLLENGCEVDIIMASDSWGASDNALPWWELAHYHAYGSVSFPDRLRRLARRTVFKLPENVGSVPDTASACTGMASTVQNKSVREKVKALFYRRFPSDPVYPLDRTWLKHASRFRGQEHYDMVLSNSSPSASHKLVQLLTERHRIQYDRWVQIWEDPWYHDLYGGNPPEVEAEEHELLRAASEVFYVSPLTLEYQKQFYPDCADKMKCIPLPFLDFSKESHTEPTGEISFGYFGDYYSVTRNLIPFYKALNCSGCRGYIYGDTDLNLTPTEQITVSGRVTLDKLAEVQNRTGVLVHLCNLKGGQIPGKIYHYSATTKPILFILDGTHEEKNIIRSFFEPFQRYYFCENNKESILNGIQDISTHAEQFRGTAIDSFSPKYVINNLLK